MSKILFEIKEENLETGLRGYPCGYCTTSSVDPMKGLFYVGHSISEVVQWRPEEAIYLLYHGKKGTAEQLKAFSEDLAKRSLCSQEVKNTIRNLPAKGEPLKLLAGAILVCGMLERTDDYRQDCLNLIAKIPELAALVLHHHAGWGEINPSRPNLGYMENFAQMLKVPKGNTDTLVSTLKLFNIVHYDHDGGNLSTFVGKAVASGLEDLYGSIAASMLALSGHRHGRANLDSIEFIHLVYKQLGDSATEQQVEQFIRERLKNNQLVYGFGHAVLRVEDPRATIMYDAVEKISPNHPLVKIARYLRSAGTRVLRENPKISNPYPNLDGISGTLLTASGFDYPVYFPLLFGLSRVVGISIQVVYERCEARDGKGTPIVRPAYFYRDRFTS